MVSFLQLINVWCFLAASIHWLFLAAQKRSTGRTWETFGGFEVFEPYRLLCSWKSFKHLLALFQGWRGCMDLLSLVECYAFLPEGLSVGQLKHHMQLSLNQASCSRPPFWWLDETLVSLRWGLGADCSGSSLLLCCFSILKWLQIMGKQCFSQNVAF